MNAKRDKIYCQKQAIIYRQAKLDDGDLEEMERIKHDGSR